MKCATVFFVGLAVVLALLGAFFCTHMLIQHVAGKSLNPFLEQMCGGAKSNCNRVLTSRWGVFPPRPAPASMHVRMSSRGSESGSTAAAREFRMPVSALGLIYFSFLLAWFIAVGRPNVAGRCWHLLIFLVVLAGCSFSGYFIYVMAKLLKMWCPLCTVTHGINFALLILMVVMWPRRGRATTEQPSGSLSAAAGPLLEVIGIPHPSCRLVGLTIGMTLMFWVAGGLAAAAVLLQGQATQLTETIRDLQQHPDILVRIYEKEKKQEVLLFPDETPSEGKGDPPWTLVMFADLQCIRCQQFERFVTDHVEPLFEGRLRVVLKHYPLCHECNPYAAFNVSPQACEAAYAAAAARTQGGNKAFREFNAELMARGEDMTSVDYGELAKLFDLDPEQLRQDMRSPAIVKRIRDDIELANRLGVEGTPAVFLNGRRVPHIAMAMDHHDGHIGSLGFWELIAKMPGDSSAMITAPAPAATTTLPAGGSASR